jgi:hypothetical protein
MYVRQERIYIQEAFLPLHNLTQKKTNPMKKSVSRYVTAAAVRLVVQPTSPLFPIAPVSMLGFFYMPSTITKKGH